MRLTAVLFRDRKKLILILAGALLALAGCSQTSQEASTPTAATAESGASTEQDSVTHELTRRALEDLHTFAKGLADLCDPIEDPKLADVRLGTISRTDFTGPLAKPLPAIVARHDYICVNRLMAQKERQTDEWVILAIDQEFQLFRCERTSNKAIVDQLIQQCGFQESGASSHPDSRVPSASSSPNAERPASNTPPAPVAVEQTTASVPSPAPPEVQAPQMMRDAIELMKAKRYAEALPLFEQAAAQNDPRAQTNLGWMYVLGQGVARDNQRAVALFRQAAEQGFPNAQDSLGWMFQHGRGVPRDETQAVLWYRKAADQGFVKSKQNLAALGLSNP